MHIEVLQHRPDTPEPTIRARLSEAVWDGLLDRPGDGFYDVYVEDENMMSVVSYQKRCSQFGDSKYRGNCDGRLIKNLIYATARSEWLTQWMGQPRTGPCLRVTPAPG